MNNQTLQPTISAKALSDPSGLNQLEPSTERESISSTGSKTSRLPRNASSPQLKRKQTAKTKPKAKAYDQSNLQTISSAKKPPMKSTKRNSRHKILQPQEADSPRRRTSTLRSSKMQNAANRNPSPGPESSQEQEVASNNKAPSARPRRAAASKGIKARTTANSTWSANNRVISISEDIPCPCLLVFVSESLNNYQSISRQITRQCKKADNTSFASLHNGAHQRKCISSYLDTSFIRDAHLVRFAGESGKRSACKVGFRGEKSKMSVLSIAFFIVQRHSIRCFIHSAKFPALACSLSGSLLQTESYITMRPRMSWKSSTCHFSPALSFLLKGYNPTSFLEEKSGLCKAACDGEKSSPAKRREKIERG